MVNHHFSLPPLLFALLTTTLTASWAKGERIEKMVVWTVSFEVEDRVPKTVVVWVQVPSRSILVSLVLGDSSPGSRTKVSGGGILAGNLSVGKLSMKNSGHWWVMSWEIDISGIPWFGISLKAAIQFDGITLISHEFSVPSRLRWGLRIRLPFARESMRSAQCLVLPSKCPLSLKGLSKPRC